MSDDITKFVVGFLKPCSGDDLNIGVSGRVSKRQKLLSFLIYTLYRGVRGSFFQQHQVVM